MPTLLPTEVELAYELMPCQALRVAQDPAGSSAACRYFRQWGTYHSFDYREPGHPDAPEVPRASYVGRARLVPEMLSGCRKAPILAVGINPNLPGWWPALRGSLNPWFDDVRQYAYYFRYRRAAKPALAPQDYASYGGGPADAPPGSQLELDVPADAQGLREVDVQWNVQTMYRSYQGLLEELAIAMHWPVDKLALGEDLSYGNMVACPSAKWTTKPDPQSPDLPPMTEAQRDGIVHECFHQRRHFLRQLFQSLPSVVLVFSQNTANAFLGELESMFTEGAPRPGETIAELMKRRIVLSYGTRPGGGALDARVLFGPHPTGDPDGWAESRPRVIAQLVEAAQEGRIVYDDTVGHLERPPGSCSFCPTLDIGPCEYRDHLRPLGEDGVATVMFAAEKAFQAGLLSRALPRLGTIASSWRQSDDPPGPDPEVTR